ncbi:MULTISPECIES: DUF4307 domain-containing protein [Micrococcaceae]|uniref:DUF4307 domain-containing protein n=1 Tax=unclassified Arthrobacter TaxID=235627 RepID=UPI00063DB56E|nr:MULTISPECIES: DUF4307 domain-containing protein [unclassified Arthrobacter]ALD63167.1 hypothetical protein AFL94_03555 [Arthrobacter sp. LS16]ALQ31611.1 hypothetical protein ATC04_14320 [Arthrobacter sp. YC-RL1]KLI89917.1 hypothetical protein AA310_04600 [Arthrobacter sp. YC-RL1]RKS20975.1 uncharacterized protein DUF4307 [Arthrobacter sp. AG1021]
MSDPSLTARYNNPKKRHLSKKNRNILIGSALVIGIAGAAYFASSNYDALSYQDVSFDVESPTMAQATIAVEYNAKDRVQCDVRAMNKTKAIVGFKTIVLDPGEQTGVVKQTLTVDLHTDNLAVTAGIEECTVVPQDFKG